MHTSLSGRACLIIAALTKVGSTTPSNEVYSLILVGSARKGYTTQTAIEIRLEKSR